MQTPRPAQRGAAPLRSARLHPGAVLQCFDHFVLDLRGPTEGCGTYCTVYAVEFSPQLGTGHVAFIRIRGEDTDEAVDLTVTDAPDMARRMQARLRSLVRVAELSRGIGTDLDGEPTLAHFERLPFTDRSAGWSITAPDLALEARWLGPGQGAWTEGIAGTLTPERDILGVLIEFDGGSLVINGRTGPGEPYDDPFWDARIGRPFRSVHVAMAETSLAPAGSWWEGRMARKRPEPERSGR